jgi:hypothetical protein
MIAGIDRTTLLLTVASLLAVVGTLVPDVGMAIAVVLLGILAASTLIERFGPGSRQERHEA